MGTSKNNGNNKNNGNRTGNGNGSGNKNNGNRTNVNNGNINTGNVNINRNVVANPVYGGGGAYGWNHGVAWAPAGAYWGGGFWGAMAVGVTSAAVYGSIVSNGTTYNSYHVQPDTPGSTFLATMGSPRSNADRRGSCRCTVRRVA